MSFVRSTIIVIVWVFCEMSATCQSLYVWPAQTDIERIDLLTGTPVSIKFSLKLRDSLHFDTNLEDFARAGIRHPKATTYHGGDGYFTSGQFDEIDFSKGFWEVSHANGSAEIYRANHDGIQLYLDSVSSTINTNFVYNPTATLNRSKGERWRIAYTSPLHVRSHTAAIQIAGNYFQFGRAQFGTLNGATVNGQFHGTIDLDTTVGLQAEQINSQGLSLDIGLSGEILPNVRLGASFENLLGYVWQTHIQKIRTIVTTNTLTPNSDGFLQDVPLLSGEVAQSGKNSEIRTRSNFGLAYHESRHDWLILLDDETDWRAQLGGRFRLGRNARWWALVSPSPFQWQLGIDACGFTMQLGLSSVDIGTSQRATLQVGYRVFL